MANIGSTITNFRPLALAVAGGDKQLNEAEFQTLLRRRTLGTPDMWLASFVQGTPAGMVKQTGIEDWQNRMETPTRIRVMGGIAGNVATAAATFGLAEGIPAVHAALQGARFLPQLAAQGLAFQAPYSAAKAASGVVEEGGAAGLAQAKPTFGEMGSLVLFAGLGTVGAIMRGEQGAVGKAMDRALAEAATRRGLPKFIKGEALRQWKLGTIKLNKVRESYGMAETLSSAKDLGVIARDFDPMKLQAGKQYGMLIDNTSKRAGAETTSAFATDGAGVLRKIRELTDKTADTLENEVTFSIKTIKEINPISQHQTVMPTGTFKTGNPVVDEVIRTNKMEQMFRSNQYNYLKHNRYLERAPEYLEDNVMYNVGYTLRGTEERAGQEVSKVMGKSDLEAMINDMYEGRLNRGYWSGTKRANTIEAMPFTITRISGAVKQGGFVDPSFIDSFVGSIGDAFKPLGAVVEDATYGIGKSIKSAAGHFDNWFSTPIWKAMNHPKFKPVYYRLRQMYGDIYNRALVDPEKWNGLKGFNALSKEQQQVITGHLFLEDKGAYQLADDGLRAGNIKLVGDETHFAPNDGHTGGLPDWMNDNPAMAQGYKEVRAWANNINNNRLETFKHRIGYYEPDITPQKRAQLDANIKESYKALKGYMPHWREGEIVLAVVDKDNNLIHMDMRARPSQARERMAQLEKTYGSQMQSDDHTYMADYIQTSRKAGGIRSQAELDILAGGGTKQQRMFDLFKNRFKRISARERLTYTDIEHAPPSVKAWLLKASTDSTVGGIHHPNPLGTFTHPPESANRSFVLEKTRGGAVVDAWDVAAHESVHNIKWNNWWRRNQGRFGEAPEATAGFTSYPLPAPSQIEQMSVKELLVLKKNLGDITNPSPAVAYRAAEVEKALKEAYKFQGPEYHAARAEPPAYATGGRYEVTGARIQNQWESFKVTKTGERLMNDYKHQGYQIKQYTKADFVKQYFGPFSTKGLDSAAKHMMSPLTVDDLEQVVDELPGVADAKTIEMLRDQIYRRTGNWHMIHRKGIPGFDETPEGMLKGMDYSWDKHSRSLAKTSAYHEVRGMLGSLPTELSNYTQEILRGMDQSMSARFFPRLREFMGTWMLFKPAFFIQNITQPIVVTSSELIHAGLSVPKAAAVWSTSMTDTLNFMTRKGAGMDTGLLKALKTLSDRGELNPIYTQMLTGADTAAKLNEKHAVEFLNFFGRSSERLNRTHAAIVGWKIGETKGMVGDELTQYMREFIDRTQFPYTPLDRPIGISGSGNMREVVKMVYMYKSYALNFLQRIENLRRYDKKAFTAQLLALTAMTGAGGVLPTWGIYSELHKAKTGRDPERQIRAWISNRTLNQSIGMHMDAAFNALGIDPTHYQGREVKSRGLEQGKDLVMTGLPSIFGADARSWLGMSDFPFSKVDQSLGMLQKIPTTIISAFVAASERDKKKFAAAMFPAWGQAMVTASEWAKNGVRASDGTLLYSPSDIEIALKALGIPQLAPRKMQEKREAEYTFAGYIRGQSAKYHKRIVKAQVAGDITKIASIKDEVRTWNSSHPREYWINPNYRPQQWKPARRQRDPGGTYNLPR